jgi:hypothetical protein
MKITKFLPFVLLPIVVLLSSCDSNFGPVDPFRQSETGTSDKPHSTTVTSYVSNQLPFMLHPSSAFHVGQSYFFDGEEIKGANRWAGADYLFADFDNDGYRDIFISFFTSEEEHLPFRLITFDLTKHEYVDSSHRLINNIGQPFNRRTVASDINGDGILDLIAVSHPERQDLYISYLDFLTSQGNGTWTQHTERTGSAEPYKQTGYYHGVAVGDLNNNGYKDIVVADWWYKTGIQTLINDGTGVFSYGPAIITSDEYDTNIAFTVDLFDFNDDDCLDLILWGQGTEIKRGNCDGTFGPHTVIIPTDFSWDFKYVDITGDNSKELLIYHSSESMAVGSHGIEIYKIDLDNSTATLLAHMSFNGTSHYISLDRLDSGSWVVTSQRPLNVHYRSTDVATFGGYFGQTETLVIHNNLSVDRINLPITTPVRNINYDNEKGLLSWDVILLPNNDNPFIHPFSMNNLRGQISEWLIYYSDTNFSSPTAAGVKHKIVSEKDIIREELAPNTFRYFFDIDSIAPQSVHVRIAYRFNHGMISNLSYSAKLERQRSF